MQNCDLDFRGGPVPVEMWGSFDCVDRFASKWIELRSEAATFLMSSKNRCCKQNSYDDKLVINLKKSQTLRMTGYWGLVKIALLP